MAPSLARSDACDFLRYLLGQRAPLRQPSTECIDKAVIALSSLGLSGVTHRIGQRGRRGEPELHEERQGFGRDGQIALQPFDGAG